MPIINNMSPKFKMRRILMCESDKVVELYKTLKKDSPFVGKTAVKVIMQNGAFYGVFQGDNLLACGGFCKQSTPLSFVKRLCSSFNIPKKATIIIPLAGQSAHCIRLLNFFCKDNSTFSFVLTLPASANIKLFNACFLSDMKLISLRPLENLRVHYIFFNKHAVQTEQNNSIIVSLQDTLILSRSLDQGYVGVSLQDNYVRLEKMHESGYT